MREMTVFTNETEADRIISNSGQQEPGNNMATGTSRATGCCLVRMCDHNTRETCKIVLLSIGILIGAVALITWLVTLTFK